MNDLISRQAAINAADRADYRGLTVEDVKKVTDEVVKELKQIPAADVAPVVHGEWVDTEIEKCKCSHCKDTYEIKAKFLYSYCPNCGAKMY